MGPNNISAVYCKGSKPAKHWPKNDDLSPVQLRVFCFNCGPTDLAIVISQQMDQFQIWVFQVGYCTVWYTLWLYQIHQLWADSVPKSCGYFFQLLLILQKLWQAFHNTTNKENTQRRRKKIKFAETEGEGKKRKKKAQLLTVHQYIKGPCMSDICWVLWTYMHTYIYTHIYTYLPDSIYVFYLYIYISSIQIKQKQEQIPYLKREMWVLVGVLLC